MDTLREYLNLLSDCPTHEIIWYLKHMSQYRYNPVVEQLSRDSLIILLLEIWDYDIPCYTGRNPNSNTIK